MSDLDVSMDSDDWSPFMDAIGQDVAMESDGNFAFFSFICICSLRIKIVGQNSDSDSDDEEILEGNITCISIFP